MEINGLPLHPLAVHAAVALGPIAALLALAYVVRPAWQGGLRLPMMGTAVLAVASVVLAYVSGTSFRDANAFFTAPGETADLIDEHASLANVLLAVTLGFGVVAVAAGLLHRRGGAVRLLVQVLLGATAVGVVVLVVLTGEGGARAVWTGFEG
jgi:Ni/Fe-hydrogenase subunit HybB-like protein